MENVPRVSSVSGIGGNEHVSASVLAEATTTEATVEATTSEATMMDMSEGMEVEKDVRETSALLECTGIGVGQIDIVEVYCVGHNVN